MTDEQLLGGINALFENYNGSSLPSPEEYNYWKFRENRIMYIDFTIGGEDDRFEELNLLEVTKWIINLNYEERNIPKEELKPIILFIHSYGGDLAQCFACCDVIKSSRIPIITVAMGVTMSAGFLLFICGHKRYAFEHSNLLVHEGSGGFSGTAEQVESAQANYKKRIEQMREMILANTSIDEATYKKNKAKDWYLTKEDIIKYHIADNIVKDITEIFS